MAVKTPSRTEPETPPLKTSPRRSGGWFTRVVRRVKLAFAGDDEALLVENVTRVSWRIYHNYHQLGIIDAGENRSFRLTKHGSFSARPYEDEEGTEYLVISLDMRVQRVSICRRQMAKDIEVYDLRVA